MNKTTLGDALRELDQTWRDLSWQVMKMLRVQQAVDALTRFLRWALEIRSPSKGGRR